MKHPGNDSQITPITKLFTYHIFGIPEVCKRYQVDINSYSLRITGLVDRKVALSMDQLYNNFKPISSDMILQCMTNVHWGRIHFKGARLLDVLDFAGFRKDAYKVVFHGADGFSTNLRVDEIRRQQDAFLLAYAMNGDPLTLDHGFPLRMTANHRYGYKWPKWVVKIELVDYDYKGHYEGKRGWSDEGMRGQPVT